MGTFNFSSFSSRQWRLGGPITTISLLLLTAHYSVLTVKAQTPEPVETLRIDTELVNLNVSVFNRNLSQPTIQLQQKDFAVYENGVLQEISFFAAADTPFDLSCYSTCPLQRLTRSI